MISFFFRAATKIAENTGLFNNLINLRLNIFDGFNIHYRFDWILQIRLI